MKIEPRLPELDIQTAPPPRDPLDAVLDRLAQSGYRIDRLKLHRLAQAGLVPSAPAGESAERALLGRLRRILDVERRLSPFGDLDALSFHLAASGVDDIEAGPIGRHLVDSLTKLFAIGDTVIGELRPSRGAIGPDGELRLGRSMARFVLQPFRTVAQDDIPPIETLLAAAFVAYVRTSLSNPRPNHTLHVSSTLVNLEAELEPQPRRMPEPPLSPLADRATMTAWLASQADKDAAAVGAAVRSSTALIRLHVRRYPELEMPWRDAAAACGPAGSAALQALAVVPPILAIAFLQGGRAVAEARLERTLEHLMHFWGTLSVDVVRFDLSNGAFPWVRRA